MWSLVTGDQEEQPTTVRKPADETSTAASPTRLASAGRVSQASRFSQSSKRFHRPPLALEAGGVHLLGDRRKCQLLHRKRGVGGGLYNVLGQLLPNNVAPDLILKGTYDAK